MAGKSAMTAEQAEMVRKAKTDDFAGAGTPFTVPIANSDIADMVRDFIDAIESRRGGTPLDEAESKAKGQSKSAISPRPPHNTVSAHVRP